MAQISFKIDDDCGGQHAAGSALLAGEDTARTLLERAHDALAGGDFDAYTTLFTEVSEISHEVPRYRALKTLIELGRGTTRQLTGANLASARRAVADGSLQALSAEPARPLLLAYGSQALADVGAWDGAQALAAAARRLDPDVAGVRESVSALAERSRPVGDAGKAELEVLNRAGIRAAAAARVRNDLKVSLCMIVRDEEEMLGRCLTAAAPAVDEIVVVDTGSIDRTIEIARSFGARVLQRAWTNDFSAARNVSFDAATSDWILYLDADEELAEGSVEVLKTLASRTWYEAAYVREEDAGGDGSDGAGTANRGLRWFRNRPEYRFHGRLHEQINQTLPQGQPDLIGHSELRIIHYGYLGDVRAARDKSRRNLELLEAQRQDGVDSSFWHFNVGAEYFALERVDESLREFDIAWSRVLSEGIEGRGFASALAIKRARALRAAGRHQQAVDFAAQALRYFPDFTDLIYEQGLDLIELGRGEEGEQRFWQAIEMGEAPVHYPRYRGAGSYLPRILLAGRYLERGETEPALAQLECCLRGNPDYFYGTVALYANALAKTGLDGERIVAEVERHSPQLTPRTRCALASALRESGFAATAVTQLRLVLAEQPDDGVGARVQLAFALLDAGEYMQAVAVAELVADEDPQALALVSSQLLAAALGRDREGLSRALERALALGSGVDEQRVFELWLAQLDEGAVGGRTVPEVPAAGHELLVRIMPALLARREFESFEIAVRLFMALPIPLRERREQLARIYLRAGFQRFAAREWLAVCDAEPDPRALVGLAEVALATDRPQSASEFAAEALRLEPENERAAELLAAAREGVPRP